MVYGVLVILVGMLYFGGKLGKEWFLELTHGRAMDKRIAANRMASEEFQRQFSRPGEIYHFSRSFYMDKEFQQQILRETNDMIRSLPELKNVKPVPYLRSTPGCQNYNLIKFVGEINRGLASCGTSITTGEHPFDMKEEEADAVIRWGKRELSKHGTGVRVFKTKNVFGQISYTWVQPDIVLSEQTECTEL